MQKPRTNKIMRVAAISDTHMCHSKVEKIEPVDVLIVAGDATNDNFYSIKSLGDWMRDVDCDVRIFVPGNNDILFHKNPIEAIAYLGDDIVSMSCGDTVIEYDGFKIFGTPITPVFGVRQAFSFDDSIRKWYWEKQTQTDEKIDVLITHGPPLGTLDLTKEGVNAGCPFLAEYVEKMKPTVHIFGHIHESFGREKRGATNSFNVASKQFGSDKMRGPVYIEMWRLK